MPRRDISDGTRWSDMVVKARLLLAVVVYVIVYAFLSWSGFGVIVSLAVGSVLGVATSEILYRIGWLDGV